MKGIGHGHDVLAFLVSLNSVRGRFGCFEQQVRQIHRCGMGCCAEPGRSATDYYDIESHGLPNAAAPDTETLVPPWSCRL